jgi:hypothetical protein
MMNNSELLALICKAASERWPDDPSLPGVQIAHLPKNGAFYVALHRYAKPYGFGRMVLHTAEEPSLDVALIKLARFLAPADTHQRELAEVLKELG